MKGKKKAVGGGEGVKSAHLQQRSNVLFLLNQNLMHMREAAIQNSTT